MSNSICGLCDGVFPPDYQGHSIGGVTWYCDECNEKNNKDMEERKKQWISSRRNVQVKTLTAPTRSELLAKMIVIMNDIHEEGGEVISTNIVGYDSLEGVIFYRRDTNDW